MNPQPTLWPVPPADSTALSLNMPHPLLCQPYTERDALTARRPQAQASTPATRLRPRAVAVDNYNWSNSGLFPAAAAVEETRTVPSKHGSCFPSTFSLWVLGANNENVEGLLRKHGLYSNKGERGVDCGLPTVLDFCRSAERHQAGLRERLLEAWDG